jgi:hypothetical protein
VHGGDQERSAKGAMSDVAMAMTTMIENMSCVRMPSWRPTVAMMISIAPRAFRPAPKLRAVQWSLPPMSRAPA